MHWTLIVTHHRGFEERIDCETITEVEDHITRIVREKTKPREERGYLTEEFLPAQVHQFSFVLLDNAAV